MAKNQEDPLDWDVDRVVQELCTLDRSWIPLSNPRLPEPVQFEANLRNNEVDGEALLIGSEEEDFFRDLGVRILKHKVTLRAAISQFRARSQKFKLHTLRNEADDEDEEFEDESRKRKLEAEHKFQDVQDTVDHTSIVQVQSVTDLNSETPATATSVTEQPEQKKRRITATLVTTELDGVVRNIPTEADEITAGRMNDKSSGANDISTEPIHIRPSEAYLGPEARLHLVELIEANMDHADGISQFGHIANSDWPSGRVRQINRFVKRQFGKFNSTSRYKADAVPRSYDTGFDKIAFALGDGYDEADDYDSDTLKEIQQEERERKQRAKAPAPSKMTPEDVKAVIDEAVKQHETLWAEQKLPTLNRKANRVWNNSRSYHRRGMIEQEQRTLEELDARIKKYRDGMERDEWRHANDLRRVLPSLEATIEDRQKSLWMLDLLKSSQEPKKLPSLPRAVTKKIPRQDNVLPMNNDEEILTSDFEDDLGNFIVDDAERTAEEHDELMTSSEDANDEDANGIPHAEAIASKELTSTVPVKNGHADDERPLEEGISNAVAEVSADVSTDDVPEVDISQMESPHRPTTPRRLNGHSATPSRRDSIHHSRAGMHRTSSTPASSTWAGRSNFSLSPETTQTMSKNQLQMLSKLSKLQTPSSYNGAIYRQVILSLCKDPSLLWDIVVQFGLEKDYPAKPHDTQDKSYGHIAVLVIYLFDVYLENPNQDWKFYKKIPPQHRQAIKAKEEQFLEFAAFLRESVAQQTSKKKPTNTHNSPSGRSSVSRSRRSSDASSSSERDDDDINSPSKKRKIVRNRAAQNLRESDKRRVAEQDQRRKLLRAKLAASGSTTASQKKRFIINESKEDDQGFIYVPDNIAGRIKDHQISGVRFMWNQIVMESEIRQGCLLAHTMGLGKTMQIITFLVTIADAASSDDPSISSQIPDDLKESKTLIIAPPALVNNWMDELLFWAPEGSLGNLYKIDPTVSPEERVETIQDWGKYGGILVIGYTLFKSLVKEENIANELKDGPNIVVADEAHAMKNAATDIYHAMHAFRTHSRIGLTGSPLANNVVEYHSIINWVAPNYLSDIREFRHDYAKPIEEGLSADADRNAKRKALRKLRALKDLLAPKVHRRTIAALKDDLPPKMEFIISVPLKERQQKSYELHMSQIKMDGTSTQIFAQLNLMALLCTHPSIFRQKLDEIKKGKVKDTDDVTGNVTLPMQLVSSQLTLWPKKDIEDVNLSWKIPILTKILDECKRVGDKILIFSQSLTAINYLEKLCKAQKRPMLRIDGGVSTDTRQSMVKEFNQDGSIFEVFLISTTAGGLGLNITGANRVIIFDWKFNPQHEQQAVGRAYRIGQEKPVYVYRLMCGGTFEEKLVNKGIFKLQLASRVVDEKNPIPKGQRLEELLDMPTEPPQDDLQPHRGKDTVLDSILNSEKLSAGVRSIIMTDTFEEEDVNDSVLDDEEGQLEYKRLIDEHHSRRTGRPAPVVPALGYTAQPTPNAVSSTLSLGQANGSSYAVATGQAQGRPTPAAGTTDPFPGQNGSVQPIRGALTQSEDKYWDNLQAFKGELARSFGAGVDVPALKEKRRQTAYAIAAAFGEQEGKRQPTILQRAKGTIMDCTKSQRFIEAIVYDHLSPQDLATMDQDAIEIFRQSLDDMPQEMWDAQVVAQYMNGDVERNRPITSTTSVFQTDAAQTREQMSQQQGEQMVTNEPQTQNRLDALRNPHRNADQAALAELRDHRQARQARLPTWAKEAVASGGRGVSSSASPGSSSLPRHSARNPFR